MSMTRFLMSASALVLGLLGLLATFAPDHVLRGLGAPISPALLLMVQVLGALYVGLAGGWVRPAVIPCNGTSACHGLGCLPVAPAETMPANPTDRAARKVQSHIMDADRRGEERTFLPALG